MFKQTALASLGAIDNTFAASGQTSRFHWNTCSPKMFRHFMEPKKPVENLPIVVVIPLPARTAELAKLLCDPHNCRSELGHSDFGNDGKSKIGRSPGVYES